MTVPIDAIEARAVKADPGRALLKALLLIPFLAGWLARKAVLVVSFAWSVVSYSWSAVIAGWQEAGRPRAADGGSDE